VVIAMGRPKSGETPQRNVRVPDDLWNAAKKEAKTEGRTMTDVINSALTRYVDKRRARRRAERYIPLSPELANLARERATDLLTGSVFPPRTAQLRTFVFPEHGMVTFDSNEVSRMLRQLAAGYRAPLYQVIAQDLEQLADAMDMQALKALDDLRDDRQSND
jgi:hypothetical protein